jgi:hypothetical protein
MLGRQFPTGFQFHQRQGVRCIAIDFVGAGEDEDRPFRMAAGRFQQVQGAVGVGGEIGNRLPRRPVVRRLGRRVDYRRNLSAVAPEDGVDRRRVADIHRFMAVGRDVVAKPLPAPFGAGAFAEEIRPHVVVDADDIHAFFSEEADGFSTDQARGPGYDDNRHDRNSLNSLMR